MIPKILHFIYFRENKKSFPFMMSHYLSMKSNIEVLKPEKVMFWTNDAPYERNWFRQILTEYGEKIEIKHTAIISEYKGRHIPHLSHSADVMKALIVRDFGGIYSDLDSIAINPFPDDFYNSNVPIMCPEVFKNEMLGLCMGFFLAPLGSKFFELILDEYADYTPNCEWGEYAVIRPLKIYNENKDLVRVLSEKSFEPIYLNYPDREDMFHLDRFNRVKDAYQVHLWENINKNTLKYLSPRTIKETNSTFAQVTRRFLPEKIDFDVYK